MKVYLTNLNESWIVDRLRHEWYKRASDMSHHNAYNMFNQSKIYTWKDVFK